MPFGVHDGARPAERLRLSGFGLQVPPGLRSDNHITNWEVSDQLFNTYPVAVRERLGTLTKSFTILRGEELIELGVRSCTEPQPRIMVAQATLRPLPESMTSGGSTLSMLTGKLQGMVPNLGVQPQPVPGGDRRPVRRPSPALPDGILATKIPPPRPKILVAYKPGLPPIPVVRIIGGAQNILPAHFVPFPKRL